MIEIKISEKTARDYFKEYLVPMGTEELDYQAWQIGLELQIKYKIISVVTFVNSCFIIGWLISRFI